MAVKKAVKKAAKKAAKKGAKHGPGEDLRKTYEHLQRVRVLHGALAAAHRRQVETLTTLAQETMRAGDLHSSAHLLRAAEHLAFGQLAQKSPDATVTPALKAAAKANFEDTMQRAEKRSVDGRVMPQGVMGIFDAMREAADEAFAAGALHKGLELARGAEALTHVEIVPGKRLEGGGKRHALPR